MKKLGWLLVAVLAVWLCATPAFAVQYKSAVQDVTNLPTTGNSASDVRVVIDGRKLFQWNGTTWLPVGYTLGVTPTYAAPVQDVTGLPADAANSIRSVAGISELLISQGGGTWSPLGPVTASTSITATNAISAGTSISAGTTITAGTGLTVTSGGIAISGGGLTVVGAETISTTLGVVGIQTSTGAIYANGGIDRSTAAALLIGAVHANAVTITPNTTITGTLGVTGTVTHSGAVINSTTVTNTGAVTNSSTVTGPGAGYGIYNVRKRVTLAQLNTGYVTPYTLVTAVTGRQIRLINCKMIAYGGNMAHTLTATGVAIYGTQTTQQALYTVNIAQLSESTVNTIGTASTVVLADGASFVDNDAATAITCGAVGAADLITATGVDIDITYAIE